MVETSHHKYICWTLKLCSANSIAIIKYYACAKSIFEEYLTIWKNAHYKWKYQILKYLDPKKIQKMVNSDYIREVTLQKILMLLFIPFCAFYILNSHTLS